MTTWISILRDQNFGINDLAAIQDVRNDFTQQDIDESTVIKDKGRENTRLISGINHAKTLTLISLAFFPLVPQIKPNISIN